jgi:AbrB family looped-hinge helix DNA binding protein
MRVTSKGQVTIPADLRAMFGFLPHSEVEFIKSKEGLLIRSKKRDDSRGDMLVRHMTGKATVQMTTDEIMELTRGDHD